MSQNNQFNKIYQDNYHKVFGLCLGYVSGNEELAKELVQQVFIKVWENLKNFRNQAKLSTWIYRIAVNTCLQELRKKKKYSLIIDVPDEIDTEVFEKEERFRAMYHCINQLSKENRSIILLDLEEVSQTEIAEIIGISYEALRTRIHRIKDKLSKCVKNE
ncbi:RNA polymerase sigma factor [Gillisia hiemivivida]|uniref:RNA polymerase sigma factor n=1 Tax=Gillisia hiemivivida TaxID=291190 RepID=A0A5C6ZSE2_9FLAO|nr:RNA polymerase sigma factor [Gillisia hiemivivida]TXD92686.1 RNA polymerase sigma factor [Gillisia hiemivivida]